jgi:serine/threonine protein kinase
MTFQPGFRLGPYEVLSPLGAGGMGEVWRARDTRLGREVALKVLPEEVALNPARLKRFEKEARSASALNHPNIVTVYDIGTADATSWIAMELVDGKTLRDLVLSGPMPLKKLLGLSTQIADGLARAHDAGILHRDLKPENVMVSRDGLIKILDFGLAKLTRSSPGDVEGSRLPTETGTSPGVVLGTVCYMSPEQACGHPLDFRSDQFSLGAIVYEMSTGKRAFEKANAPDTLSAILHEEPPPLTQALPQAPPPLSWVVERCLAKEPGDRYASTRDLARDLANLRDRVSQASSSAHLLAASPARRRSWRWLAAAALLLAGVAIGLVGSHRPPEEPPLYRRLTYHAGPIWSARFAPDGQTIIYSSSQAGKPHQLFSTRVDTPEWTALSLPSGNILSISSSGNMAIAIWPEHNYKPQTLAEVSMAGGAPREILVDDAELGAAWSPDGQNLAVVRDFADHGRLEFPIGRVLYQTQRGKLGGPSFSPDGKSIAIFEETADQGEVIALVDLAGKKRTLSSGWANIEAGGMLWNAKTNEIWFSGREASGGAFGLLALHAVSPSGRLRLVARLPANLGINDVSPDGRVLVSVSDYPCSIVCLPPGSTKEVNLTWLDFSSLVDISEDGKTVLFDEMGSLGSAGRVYLRRTDGSPAVRLGEGRGAAISQDGKWAIAIPSTSDRLVLLPTGPGVPKILSQDGLRYVGARFFPGGKQVLFAASASDRPARLYVQDTVGGPARPLTPEGFEIGPISPDGRLVAAHGPDGTVALVPVGGGPVRSVTDIARDERIIHWDGTGEALFLAKEGAPVRIDRFVLSTSRREHWKDIEPADPSNIVLGTSVALTPDGNSYAYSFARELSYLYVVDGLR